MHSRCDLACDHCYIYEHADQSWRGRPLVMSLETVRAAAMRIAEHASGRGLAAVHVVLHGGEPLLLGVDGLRAAIVQLRQAIEPVATLDLRLQSNGVLLSPQLCDLFVEHRVAVGISLDGDRDANDRHRRFAHGASSHEQVLAALALLRRQEYSGIYAGILCTIDIDNDPVAVYQALRAERPPRIDLLLPHATWDRPPRRGRDDPTPYATWLRRVYERWLADGCPMPIRLFDSLLATAAGGPSGTESVGLDPADLVVVETDGTWEQADSLKTAFDGAPATGLNVFSHSVDEVAALPEIAGRQSGLSGLCSTCQACPVVHQCGGGLFAHRFRTANGFDNPSAYCADLAEFIALINSQPPATRLGHSRVEPSDDPPGRWDLDAELLAALDDLGGGYAGAATVRYLADAESAIGRALVAAVAAAAGSDLAAAGWDLLVRLDHEAPQAVRAVLAHPYTRAWAVGCLSRAGADADYLACLAAAAAIRCGARAQLDVPVGAGGAHLPTLGTLTPPAGVRAVLLCTSPEGFTVRSGGEVSEISDVNVVTGGTRAGLWRPTPRLVADGLDIAIDDDDPSRGCYSWPAGERLDEAGVDGWRGALAGAWREISDVLPAHIPAMGELLRSVTPLRAVAPADGEPDAAWAMRSATARQAFGAVGIALASPDALAVMLVHEFQHTKLGALLDVCELVDSTYHGRLRVAWRPDPRPVEGALQGTYAHLGVADVWRARAARPGALRDVARERFELYRGWTAEAIDALLAARGALTPPGVRFVSQLAAAVANWSVPATTASRATGLVGAA